MTSQKRKERQRERKNDTNRKKRRKKQTGLHRQKEIESTTKAIEEFDCEERKIGRKNGERKKQKDRNVCQGRYRVRQKCRDCEERKIGRKNGERKKQKDRNVCQGRCRERQKCR